MSAQAHLLPNGSATSSDKLRRVKNEIAPAPSHKVGSLRVGAYNRSSQPPSEKQQLSVSLTLPPLTHQKPRQTQPPNHNPKFKTQTYSTSEPPSYVDQPVQLTSYPSDTTFEGTPTSYSYSVTLNPATQPVSHSGGAEKIYETLNPVETFESWEPINPVGVYPVNLLDDTVLTDPNDIITPDQYSNSAFEIPDDQYAEQYVPGYYTLAPFQPQEEFEGQSLVFYTDGVPMGPMEIVHNSEVSYQGQPELVIAGTPVEDPSFLYPPTAFYDPSAGFNPIHPEPIELQSTHCSQESQEQVNYTYYLQPFDSAGSQPDSTVVGSQLPESQLVGNVYSETGNLYSSEYSNNPEHPKSVEVTHEQTELPDDIVKLTVLDLAKPKKSEKRPRKESKKVTKKTQQNQPENVSAKVIPVVKMGPAELPDFKELDSPSVMPKPKRRYERKQKKEKIVASEEKKNVIAQIDTLKTQSQEHNGTKQKPETVKQLVEQSSNSSISQVKIIFFSHQIIVSLLLCGSITICLRSKQESNTNSYSRSKINSHLG